MAAEIFNDLPRATNANGVPVDGAQWFFYATGTTTPQAVYSDAALTTSLGAVVSADSGGKFVPVYFDATKTYRGVLKTPSGSTLRDIDPVNSGILSALAASSGSSLVGFLPAGTGAVSRTVESKLRDFVSVKDFGAAGDGVTSDTAAFAAALVSGAKRIYVPKGTYAIATQISATLPNDVELFSEGKLIWTGASSTANLMLIQCAGHSFTINGLTFDGGNLIVGGPRIENQSAMDSNTLPVCRVENCTFINFRMNSAALYNDGCVIRGSFERAVVRNNSVRNITRAAGTGTPGSAGTAGISVAQYDTTKWVRLCIHEGNSYSNITGDDLLASANNVDYDAFRYFAPDPTSFANSDTTVYSYGSPTLVSRGNSYRNCRGRAIKAQAVATVSNEKIIRDSDYTIYGGSTEINLQYGVGTVRDCEFYYHDYLVSSTVTSPIQGALTLVSFYQGSWYNEASGGISVSGLRVYNAIKSGVGSNISVILGLTSAGTPSTKDRPLIELSDVVVNRGSVDWIVTTSFSTGAYAILRMDAIVVAALTYSAIGTGSGNPDCELIATGVINLDGVKTPANRKMFVSNVSPAGGNKTWGGRMTGSFNRGFLHNYNVGADFNQAPMLNGSALADPTGGVGGAASVQSVYLANDASHTFDRRFFSDNRGMILVSVNLEYTTQGVMACGSNQIHVIAAHGSHLFQASTTGSNIDTIGKLNLWFTGGALNIKNRLGGTYSITVMFLG